MVLKGSKKDSRGSMSARKKKKVKEDSRFIKRKRTPSKQELSKLEENYEPPTDNCVICFDSVVLTRNNIVTCLSNVQHCLCAHCKIRIIDSNQKCPMCRSHSIKHPIHETEHICIYQTGAMRT